jgi:hypothetical protein
MQSYIVPADTFSSPCLLVCIVIYCCIVSKCSEIINKACVSHAVETLGVTILCRLPNCWLVVSKHLEGPVTGHLDTVSWFSSDFKQMPRWFSSPKLLLHASHAALPILNHEHYTLL